MFDKVRSTRGLLLFKLKLSKFIFCEHFSLLYFQYDLEETKKMLTFSKVQSDIKNSFSEKHR